MMLCCRHSSAMGSVMAGSAFCARKTCFARPHNSAFFNCFAPTTTLQQVKSGKLPHFGILLSFLVSIQKHIIRTFSKKSTITLDFFILFSLSSLLYTNQLWMYGQRFPPVLTDRNLFDTMFQSPHRGCNSLLYLLYLFQCISTLIVTFHAFCANLEVSA